MLKKYLYNLNNFNYYLFKINQQEILICSLETTSTKSFDFTNFNYHYKSRLDLLDKNIINNINSNWLEWFIGFVEGDGALLKSNNRLFFIITQKDINVLIHIQKTLGFGQVTIYASKNYDIYHISKKRY